MRIGAIGEEAEAVMSGKVEARLKELGIALPAAMPPWASYVSFVLSGQQVYLSGQLPQLGEETDKGKLGLDLGLKAPPICASPSSPSRACGGNLDRVTRCVEIGGFVNSAPNSRITRWS